MGVVYVCLYLSVVGRGNTFISSREPKCSDYYEHLNFRAKTERIIRGGNLELYLSKVSSI